MFNMSHFCMSIW